MLKKIRAGEYSFNVNGTTYLLIHYSDLGFWDVEFLDVSIFSASTKSEATELIKQWINSGEIPGISPLVKNELKEKGANVC